MIVPSLGFAGTAQFAVICNLILGMVALIAFQRVGDWQKLPQWQVGGLAVASGLAVNWLHYGLLSALSLTIVATLNAAGLILAIGLLIGPGAIAFLLVRRFSAMLAVSVVVCMGSMLAGTYASFFLDSAPAPTIILILTGLFIIAFIYRQIRTRRASRLRVGSAST